MGLEDFGLEMDLIAKYNTTRLPGNGGISEIEIFQTNENSYIMIVKLNGKETHFFLGDIKSVSPLDASLLNEIVKKLEYEKYEYSDSFESKECEKIRKQRICGHVINLMRYVNNSF